MCSMEEVDEIARRPNSIPISCHFKLNMDGLLERIWEMMALVRDSANNSLYACLYASQPASYALEHGLSCCNGSKLEGH